MSDKLTFGDLSIGDKFIGFPFPGDDSGHGGYKGGHVLYTKIKRDEVVQAKRVSDGICTVIPDEMEVIKIV